MRASTHRRPARAGNERLSGSYPAVPSTPSVVRRAVAAIAIEAGATAEQVYDIRLSTSEALTNAIVHGYRGRPGEVRVTAAVTGGELWLRVADDGDGLRSHGRPGGLGVGLTLIAGACEELTIIKRSNGGTELRMRFRLGRSRRAEHESRPARAIFSTPQAAAVEGAGWGPRPGPDTARARSPG